MLCAAVLEARREVVSHSLSTEKLGPAQTSRASSESPCRSFVVAIYDYTPYVVWLSALLLVLPQAAVMLEARGEGGESACNSVSFGGGWAS